MHRRELLTWSMVIGLVALAAPAVRAQVPTTDENRAFFGPAEGIYESGGFLYVFAGINRFPMDGINGALDPFDYADLSDWFIFGGTGAFISIDQWMFGVESYWVAGLEGSGGGTNSTSVVGGTYTLLQGAYLFNLGRSHIYPSIGVGLADFDLGLVQTRGPSFDEDIGSPQPQQSFNFSAYVLQVSLGWQWLFRLSSSDPNRVRGILLGWRVGYVFAPFGWDWRLNGSVVTDAPDMPIGFGLLSIQLGFGGWQIGAQ